MDYGPIILRMTAQHEGHYVGCQLHTTEDCENPHTVLLIGWRHQPDLQWHIKDSWPDDNKLLYSSVNVFDYGAEFFRVYPKTSNDSIDCVGNGCSIFTSRYFEDKDLDGFFNWGYDSMPKPSLCLGPDFMDFDDGDDTIIFRDGYTPLKAPSIESPVKPCTDSTFTLIDVPSIMTDSVTWKLTPTSYFNSPKSGTGNIAALSPISGNIGKQCKVTFTIHYNGEVEYEKIFYPNGPAENQVSVAVEDAYGGSPPKYGSTYYLCPNSTYYIYYNNSDGNCATSNFDWDLPYGWTEYWSSNNMVAINTNNYPDGQLDIEAETCCSSSRVTVYTQYFDEDEECGEYFRAFPNPTDNYVDIDVIKEKFAAENISLDAECILTIFDKTGLVKYKNEFKGFPYRIDTSNLPEGLYFINLLYNGKMSSIRLVVEH